MFILEGTACVGKTSFCERINGRKDIGRLDYTELATISPIFKEKFRSTIVNIIYNLVHAYSFFFENADTPVVDRAPWSSSVYAAVGRCLAEENFANDILAGKVEDKKFTEFLESYKKGLVPRETVECCVVIICSNVPRTNERLLKRGGFADAEVALKFPHLYTALQNHLFSLVAMTWGIPIVDLADFIAENGDVNWDTYYAVLHRYMEILKIEVPVRKTKPEVRFVEGVSATGKSTLAKATGVTGVSIDFSEVVEKVPAFLEKGENPYLNIQYPTYLMWLVWTHAESTTLFDRAPWSAIVYNVIGDRVRADQTSDLDVTDFEALCFKLKSSIPRVFLENTEVWVNDDTAVLNERIASRNNGIDVKICAQYPHFYVPIQNRLFRAIANAWDLTLVDKTSNKK